jgi:hypothetical protein
VESEISFSLRLKLNATELAELLATGEDVGFHCVLRATERKAPHRTAEALLVKLPLGHGFS